MPDWSYQTILRPLLFKLPPERARDFTLNAMGTLANLPFGGAVIDLMGHMRPPESVSTTVLGIDFPSRVGLGAGLDVNGRAAKALARFGFGFLELGPVTEHPMPESGTIERQRNAISYPLRLESGGADALKRRLERDNLTIPIGIRLASASANVHKRIIEQLAPHARFFSLDVSEMNPATLTEHLTSLQEAAPCPILIATRPDVPIDSAKRLVNIGLECGIKGIMVSGGVKQGDHFVVGAPAYKPAMFMVQQLHAEFHDQITIIASGNIAEPRNALYFLDMGASLIQIHSGLVFSGPGLPKRINEAIAFYRTTQFMPAPSKPRSILPQVPAWVWAGALGAMLVISAIIVGIVAMTRIVLPYDEAFVGLTRDQLAAINPRLLPFMAHDRVTVAGTMLSTGILYVGLALGGIRRGHHWALMAFLISALSGFLSFFLFIGYGYFDPLHAVLSLGLLPLFLASLFAKRAPLRFTVRPNTINTVRWYYSQWGQLMFVLIGVGLITAGIAIMSVGVTSVFVTEDLAFMQTSASILDASNPRLVPLVAHDRAGFGGNLVSVGLAVLLLALWGFRQGERWVWWTLALSGSSGFIAAIGIHLIVGYTDLWHLFPALLALFLFGLGSVFSFHYLFQRHA